MDKICWLWRTVCTNRWASKCYPINSTAWFVAFTVSNLTASNHLVSFSRLLWVPMEEDWGTMKSFHESCKCITGGKITSDSSSFQGGNKEKHEAMLYLICSSDIFREYSRHCVHLEVRFMPHYWKPSMVMLLHLFNSHFVRVNTLPWLQRDPWEEVWNHHPVGRRAGKLQGVYTSLIFIYKHG